MKATATATKAKPVSILSQLSFVWLALIVAVAALYTTYTLLQEFFPAGIVAEAENSAENPATTETPTPTPSPTPEAKHFGLPVRLWIPKIGLDANVQHLGLTPDGQLDSPNNMTDVGWYKDGPPPGDAGSAVIDGHRGVNETGVFENLYKLETGDVVLVYDEFGETIVFKVLESRIYQRDENPEEVFKSSEGSHLNLITCDGTYERDRGGTPNRLVVFTDMID